MSEPAKPAETPAAEPDKLTMGGLIQAVRDEIANALDGLFKSGKADVVDTADAKPAKTEPGPDINAQVREAMAQIADDEKKAKKAEGADPEKEALKKEVERLKALAEKVPRQVRKVERVMGWRLDDDE